MTEEKVQLSKVTGLTKQRLLMDCSSITAGLPLY